MEYAKQIIPSQDKILAHFIQAGIAEIIKEKIILKQQDIIYSLGLFDYLEDKIAKRLLKNLYNKLKIGGLLLTGNFSSNHPLQVLMEVFGNWKLIYRKEEELLAIAKNSMPDGRHFIMAEPEGINLILVSSKPR